MEQTREALARVHLENVRNATFEEKVRVIEILDVKVYLSENLHHVGVACAVNLAGLEDEEPPFCVIRLAWRRQSCRNDSVRLLLAHRLG